MLVLSHFIVVIECHCFVIVLSINIISKCAWKTSVTRVKPVLTTKMHLCLKLDEILDMILLKLSLRSKFTTLAVSRKWRQTSFVLLRLHKSVVLFCNTPDGFNNEHQCKNHPVTWNNVITCVGHRKDFWMAVFSYLPGIEYVYLDTSYTPTGGTCYWFYYDLLNYVIAEYGSQLKCLWIPGRERDNFPDIPILPELRDLYLTCLTDYDVQHILNTCPKLEYLKCDTKNKEWHLLPKGFKRLGGDGDVIQGLNSLLVSPAAETIEEIEAMQLPSVTVFSGFRLPCLKVLHVEINKAPNDCLNSLARIARFSPVLTKLTLKIHLKQAIENLEDMNNMDDMDNMDDMEEIQEMEEAQETQEMEGASWSRVIEECTRVTHFSLHLNPCGLGFNVNSWQDHFACSIALNMKNLKHLYVDFALSSTGLTALSSLPQLEFFRHKLYQEKGVDNTVFSKDALYSFLTTQFSHKLSHYEIQIPSFFGNDLACLKITQKFADGLVTMAQHLPLKIILQAIYRVGGLTYMLETRLGKRGFNYQKIKRAGTIFATELKIDKRH